MDVPLHKHCEYYVALIVTVRFRHMHFVKPIWTFHALREYRGYYVALIVTWRFRHVRFVKAIWTFYYINTVGNASTYLNLHKLDTFV